VLPILSRIETPRAVPNSIADDVLAKYGKKAASAIVALVLAGGLMAGGTQSAKAADEHGGPTPPSLSWSFAGPFGKFDRGALQRGYKVYKEVCSTCHSMSLIHFRNLADVGGPASLRLRRWQSHPRSRCRTVRTTPATCSSVPVVSRIHSPSRSRTRTRRAQPMAVPIRRICR
jgi:hypothetical protein